MNEEISMRKSLSCKLLIFCLSVSMLLQGCANTEADMPKVNYEFYYLKDYWELMPLEDSYFQTQESLESVIWENPLKI